MNKLKQLFKIKKKNILSVYFTAGYPLLNDTSKILRYLEKGGADFVEIGMPFSDPVADGEVIQMSSQRALKNGMNLKLLFEQLREVRYKVSIPVILMGYLNPVLSMGMDKFLEKCSETGIDGLILPDFPPEEYRKSYRDHFRKYNISNILLITPQTPQERIREIDRLSDGFIYMVSSYSTTGAKDSFNERQINYFRRINEMALVNPLVTGFGVSNSVTFRQACQYSSGAIIGSAFIKELDTHGASEEVVKNFVRRFRTAESVMP